MWQIMNIVITQLLGLRVILEVYVYSWTILSKEKENLLKSGNINLGTCWMV